MAVAEHWDRNRLKSAYQGLRARVISDFRDFQFSWNGFFKWSGITLLALLIAALITLYFLDWNQMRGPLGRYLSHQTGREVRIDGDLKVNLFTLQPSIDVRRLYIGNPSWLASQGRPQAAQVTQARIELRLLPLILGNLILPLVQFNEPDVLIVRDATGRTNWDSAGSGDAWHLPPIRRFLIDNGHVVIEDDVRGLRFTGTVTSEESSGGGGRAAFTLAGDGTLNKSKFLANVTGGPLLNVDETKPYPFNADIRAGETHAVIDGQITQPFHLDRFDANIKVNGRTLSDLYFLTGLVLPNTPPYQLTVSVVREGTLYRLKDISGVLGSTDIVGNLSVDASNEIPTLRGKVASRVLNFEDLGAVIGGGKTVPTKYLLPETVMHTERLRQTNTEVDYTARAIKSRDFPLTSLDTHISLQGGVLNLKPLAFGFTQGKLSGSLKVDARKAVPVTSVDARITDIHAENFIKSSDKPISGVLEARAVLTGTGNSVHAAASSANGTFTAVVPSGGMRHSLAEWTGVDVLTALSLSLSGDDSNTNLRCAVASFEAKDGLLTAQRFVIDTDPVRIDGGGAINLKDETLDLRLQGKPKNFQIVRARAPITVKGSMARPALGIEAGPLVAQGGIAAALGLLNPLASILAFIDPGLAKDANCAPLLSEAKAKGAPVKPAAVRNAPAPRN